LLNIIYSFTYLANYMNYIIQEERKKRERDSSKLSISTEPT